jgi:hypothetical protein
MIPTTQVEAGFSKMFVNTFEVAKCYEPKKNNLISISVQNSKRYQVLNKFSMCSVSELDLQRYATE